MAQRSEKAHGNDGVDPFMAGSLRNAPMHARLGDVGANPISSWAMELSFMVLVLVQALVALALTLVLVLVLVLALLAAMRAQVRVLECAWRCLMW
jgi:hypothetical protein